MHNFWSFLLCAWFCGLVLLVHVKIFCDCGVIGAKQTFYFCGCQLATGISSSVWCSLCLFILFSVMFVILSIGPSFCFSVHIFIHFFNLWILPLFIYLSTSPFVCLSICLSVLSLSSTCNIISLVSYFLGCLRGWKENPAPSLSSTKRNNFGFDNFSVPCN